MEGFLAVEVAHVEKNAIFLVRPLRLAKMEELGVGQRVSDEGAPMFCTKGMRCEAVLSTV